MCVLQAWFLSVLFAFYLISIIIFWHIAEHRTYTHTDTNTLAISLDIPASISQEFLLYRPTHTITSCAAAAAAAPCVLRTIDEVNRKAADTQTHTPTAMWVLNPMAWERKENTQAKHKKKRSWEKHWYRKKNNKITFIYLN